MFEALSDAYSLPVLDFSLLDQIVAPMYKCSFNVIMGH